MRNGSNSKDINVFWMKTRKINHIWGTRLAQFPPGSSRCGGWSAGWSNSRVPGKAGESVDIDICFDSDSGNVNDCRISTRGKMTNCGTYFVYYLDNVPSCRANYCASFWCFILLSKIKYKTNLILLNNDKQ